MQTSYIYDIDNTDRYNFGNKANNIRLLKSNGINVPKTYVIPNTVIEKELKQSQIIASNNNSYNESNLMKIREYILKGINCEFYIKIFDELEKIINKKLKYAIRSSALNEDGAISSFAGLFKTHLNIGNTSNIINCILDCWSYCYEEFYSHYCNNYNISACNIMIQEMAKSSCSGVAFKSENFIIINANYGLAKSIVDGTSGYETWKYNLFTNEISIVYNDKDTAIIPVYGKTNPLKDDYIICCDIVNQPKLIVNSFDNTHGYVSVELSNELKNNTCLNVGLVKELSSLVLNISRIINEDNCDIEWAMDSKNIFTILQARKLTKKINFDYTSIKQHNSLEGMGIVSGDAKGKAIYVSNEVQAKKFVAGNILVAKRIEGAVLKAANKASGCILSTRSPLSHSAIIAREIGLPTIGAININKINLGSYYKISGDTGKITLLSDVDL